jgi:hypothetical protein
MGHEPRPRRLVHYGPVAVWTTGRWGVAACTLEHSLRRSRAQKLAGRGQGQRGEDDYSIS